MTTKLTSREMTVLKAKFEKAMMDAIAESKASADPNADRLDFAGYHVEASPSDFERLRQLYDWNSAACHARGCALTSSDDVPLGKIVFNFRQNN